MRVCTIVALPFKLYLVNLLCARHICTKSEPSECEMIFLCIRIPYSIHSYDEVIISIIHRRYTTQYAVLTPKIKCHTFGIKL